MIKVNLATRFKKAAQPRPAGGGGSKFNFDLSRVGDLKDHFKEVPTKKLALHLAVAILLPVTLNSVKDGALATLDAQLAKINAQKPALEAQIRQMKVYEDQKKQIEADEETLKHKLEAIRKLVEGRSTVVRILADLSKLTPKAVWLTSFDLKESGVVIKGTSIDFDPINDFEKLMDENQYFKEVTTQSTQNDKRLVDFELKAKRGSNGD